MDLNGASILNEEVGDYSFTVILPDKTTYSIYKNPFMAISEVVYSRLSANLDLPSIKSDYCNKINNYKPFVSASMYNTLWIPYNEWIIKRHIYGDIINLVDMRLHYALSILTGLFTLNGFVTQDGFFVRAGTGTAFGSLQLEHMLKTTAPLNHSMSVEGFLELTEWFPECRRLTKQIATINNDQLQTILEMPDWELKEQVKFYYFKKLDEMRKIAKKINNGD